MADRKAEKAQLRKVADFMTELNRLTERYGLKIGGCESCCGAPWIATSGKLSAVLVEYVRYCQACKKYGPASDHGDC